jgi:deazaflavin-dependent oxidoreductase (nitroreductase family)
MGEPYRFPTKRQKLGAFGCRHDRQRAVPGDDYCHLSTIGRRTGRQHEIEIWYARAGSTLYLLAGGGRSADWVRNLEVNPRATVRLADGQHEAIGRILDGPDDETEATRARQLVFDKYQPRYDDSLVEWRDRALPVAVDFVDQAT